MEAIDTVVSSEVRRGQATTVLWELKNWNTKDPMDFLLLYQNSNCIVDIGLKSPHKEEGSELKKVTDERYQSRLNFHFKEHAVAKRKKENYQHKKIEEHCWLSLCVDQVSNLESRIIGYDFTVDLVDDKLKPIDPATADDPVCRRFHSGKITLQEEFIKLEEKILPPGEDDIEKVTPTVLPRPEAIRIKITVQPIFISAHYQHESVEKAKAEAETSLCVALKKMVSSEEIYPDLKLETKDNMTLSAHKFMLAARSPVLRDLIEKKVKDNDFNGTIKLPEMKAEPMGVIIQWMYTGELDEDVGNCMEEVVDAAIHFELSGLINILDKKVITICNQENMFQLYQVAKKNGMRTAQADISKFIKENV